MSHRDALPPIEQAAEFERLAARVREAPNRVRSAHALARLSGLDPVALEALLVVHAQRAPRQWLERERVRAATARLAAPRVALSEVAAHAGFASRDALVRACEKHLRLSPEAYRALGRSPRFALSLPHGYRAREVLAYHARDPASPCERVSGRRIFKALPTPDGPAVLEIALSTSQALCRAHASRRLGPGTMRGMHRTALAMLGLRADVARFERAARKTPRQRALVARRRGLRLPLAATPFDGLCWAIVGQQINLAFASALRRELLTLAGSRVDGMRAHPTPAQMAGLDIDVLRRRSFSRAKAEYVLTAADAVRRGALVLDELAEGSAARAETALTAVRGIGTWTARYVLMRGLGFPDCAPVGDVALAAALQRYTQRGTRPTHKEVERLMLEFSPYRSLATFHLWASLRD